MHWSSVAVQTISKPENCQGILDLIAGRCACLGARTVTNLSCEQEQSKNCDEQLTHIVRVSCRDFFVMVYGNSQDAEIIEEDSYCYILEQSLIICSCQIFFKDIVIV